MPAAAVADGDVVLGSCRDVNQEAVLAYRIVGVVLQAGEDGVIINKDIVEPIARIQFTGTGLDVFSDIMLGEVDVKVQCVGIS